MQGFSCRGLHVGGWDSFSFAVCGGKLSAAQGLLWLFYGPVPHFNLAVYLVPLGR